MLSAVTPPAHAALEGETPGAGLPGSVGGSHVVTLNEDTPASSATGRRRVGAYGARISHICGPVLHGFAVDADAGRARRLAADPHVASAVQDTRVTPDAVGGNPPLWSLGRVDRPSRPPDADHRAPGSAGAGVTVCVIDIGVRIAHADFGGRVRHGWDFVGGDRVAADGNGHGTHVAGIVAGTVSGVARKAQVAAVRVLDDTGVGTTAQVIAGIDRATRHARGPAVADLSFGGGYHAALDAAVRTSIRPGVTYTVAAGDPGRPAALHSPADVREAVTVGATGRGHARAAPAHVAKALVAGASNGKVSGRGPGSPDKLLRVPPFM
ncbi:S8 family serine peptidase [Streptomyces sp. LUP30]|uniref:S8 family serine peptidase n=1 Tax=Streptomyces sp. LUP30 TaxID=1890285 RepID=UPI000A3E3708